MIFQYESPKRTIALILGQHTSTDSGSYVTNTGGDFDPAPELDEEPGSEYEDDRFGFWPQAAA